MKSATILRSLAPWLLLAGVVLTNTQAYGQTAGEDHPGAAIYQQACASCHDNPEQTKAPAMDALQAMRYQYIDYALNHGRMQAQAAHLSTREKADVIEYLVGIETAEDSWIADMMCSDKPHSSDLNSKATVASFGFDQTNHRQLSAADAGLSKTDFAKLELAWSMGFPQATTMRSQAAVVGNNLFLPVADLGQLFALDIAGDKPCINWVYESAVPLRSSAAFGELPDGRKTVAVSDQGSNTHLVDAATGEKIWTTYVGVSPYSLTTGTPVIYQDRVIVPVSQYEITIGADPDHKCCTSHGAVVALDLVSGEKLWTAHTMPDAKPVRDRGDGQKLWGPSGAPIWNSPAIDEKRGLIYVGTGEATSEPAHKHTDAILAIDLKTGEIVWSFQATANDIFLSGCGFGRNGPNCPKPEDTVSLDVDFGASVIIAKNSKGKDILLAGQKSGTVWALDPDKNGEVIWRTDIGEGSPLGGVHWGLAYDGEQVFVPINRPFGFRPGPDADRNLKPGIWALDVDTGEINWEFQTEPDCSGDRKQRMRSCANNIGFSGAPTLIGDVVVTGSLDGFLRGFDKETGELLFQYDTAQAFETINGVEANGGAIDNASIVAANGYLFVNSGYGMFGQVPGNVTLAFRVGETGDD